MVNNIQLTWKLAWLLRTYRIYNLMVGFSKYKFYNKLLGGITLLRVTSGMIWTQPIYIYIYKGVYFVLSINFFLIIIVGIRAQKSYIRPWALFKDIEYAEEERIVIGGSKSELHSIERVEGGPRRNSSSDMVNATWVPILATRMTLQEAPLMGPCHVSIQKERKSKISKKRLLPPH